MVMRLLRRTLRGFGFDVPFTKVVCPEVVKTVSIDGQWRATVTVNRTLVFLREPEEGDLRDAFPIDPVTDYDCSIHESSDAMEITRRRVKGGTFVYWQPREAVVPYALYTHKQTWSTPGSDTETTLFTEMECDTRTGILAIEMIAPMTFQSAVAFKRPRWRRLNTERRLMKYALEQLDTSRSRPVIRDNRQRAEWKIVGPRVGDRFICIAFTAEGLEEWQQRLRVTSLAGKLKGMFGGRSAEPTSITRLS